MDLLASIAGLAAGTGNLFGSLGSSALQYYYNKDLMGYANDLNRKNLSDGPSIQRQGLEKAGYNPLLALSGYTSGLPTVSPNPVGQSDLSHLGSNIVSAFKAFSEAETEQERKDVVKSSLDVNKATVDVKNAESKDLEKSAELKEALRNKADADATKSKVETYVEPVRALGALGGSVATAYGAKKIHDMLKKGKSNAPSQVNKLQTQRIKALQKVLQKSGKKHLPIAPFFGSLGFIGSSLLGSALSAKATKSLMNHATREGHWTDKHGIERNPKWIYGGVPVLP